MKPTRLGRHMASRRANTRECEHSPYCHLVSVSLVTLTIIGSVESNARPRERWLAKVEALGAAGA